MRRAVQISLRLCYRIGMSQSFLSPVVRIGAQLLARRQWLATAESCTGGLIAKQLTDVAGSSQWFERGLVTYSNRAKQELLGVADAVLRDHGAVSEATVRAMAAGLLQHSPVDWVLAVTGIAGPGGGSAEKPVGTVWMACQRRGDPPWVECRVFTGEREQVREATAAHLLGVLLERLGDG